MAILAGMRFFAVAHGNKVDNLRIIELTGSLFSDFASRIIAAQLSRSATIIGARIVEAKKLI